MQDVRSPPKFIWSQFFIDALRERGLQSSTIGIVGLSKTLRDVEGTISFGEFNALRQGLPGASFEDATDILYRARKRKSLEEISAIERAQKCADEIQLAFRNSARPGVPEHQIYSAMFAAHIAANGEVPCMILFAAEKKFWQTQVMPTFRTVQADDVLTVEAEPKYYGYMAQLVDSVAFRKLTPSEKRLFDVSLESFQFVLSEMNPGKSYAQLIKDWEQFVRNSGCVPGRTMGHGLGLGQDGPLTTPSGDADGLLIEDGDCFVLKPWITDESEGSSVRIGGTVVVEDLGTRKLGKAALEPLVHA